MNTAVYVALPPKLRRRKNAPPRRSSGPDDRHVQVDARRDVRHGKALVIDDVRQQQVVHVAAVARHVDDFAAFVDALQAREVRDFDAVIKPSSRVGRALPDMKTTNECE